MNQAGLSLASRKVPFKSMNIKRIRGRHHRFNGGMSARQGNNQTPLNRNHVFDSNGPEMRVRGTAQQLFEKYLQLGRDATGAGDRILAEAYFQHAEHYFRIINAMTQAAQQSQAERQERHQKRMKAQQSESGEERRGPEEAEDESEGETARAAEDNAE